MKPVEVFAVVLRTVGLIVCLMASAILSFALLGNVSRIIVGTPMLLMGLWLLRGASPLLGFAFPKENGLKCSPAIKSEEHGAFEAKSR